MTIVNLLESLLEKILRGLMSGPEQIVTMDFCLVTNRAKRVDNAAWRSFGGGTPGGTLRCG
jgi:hypothetical protein